MTTIRDFLTDDHRRCDDLLAAAEQALAAGKPADAALALGAFRDAMLARFAAEEETLFPAFELATGMSGGPTQVMRMEHSQIRMLLDDAVDALQAGNSEDYQGIAETLVIMMQQHNMKEENILYPMCDQHLAADGPALLERISGKLAA